MKIFTLTGQPARLAASREVMSAPEGYVVKIAEQTRTLEQNALLWPLLTCFATQLQWPVNGVMSWLSEDDWKDLLSAAFDQEEARVSPGLGGGMVMLGKRTSQFGKRRFSAFVEFILAEGANRGVDFERKRRVA